MSQRPRRIASQKAVIILSSDSEDDSYDGKENDEYKPTETRRRFIDRTGALVASGAKRGCDTSTLPNDASVKKRRTNKDKDNSSSDQTAAATGITVETSLTEAKLDGNSDRLIPLTSSSTSGRSSFWERRRVWNIHELLAETEHIQSAAAHNIVQLFENENTIPFICRYRRDLVDNISPDRLRDIRNTYTEIVDLRKKAENIVNQLDRDNVLNEQIRDELMCAKSNEELEFLYAPYKPASKGTLAERAKALGLQQYADALLYGTAPKVQLSSAVDPNNKDLATEEQVKSGICNIMVHNISKNSSVLEELRRQQDIQRIVLRCSKAKSNAASKQSGKKASSSGIVDRKLDCSKFENYFNFQCDIKSIKPHQILAINRGEKHKFLTVKVETNNYLKIDLIRFISDQYMTDGLQYDIRKELFNRSVEDCYAKKLQPLLCRQVRAKLKEMSMRAAIDVFGKNLKQLLLMSPLKGERILGIDPGYTNGCKLALISETADVLETGIIYPHGRHAKLKDAEQKLVQLLSKHNCRIIALGNGTACRDTEMWLSSLFHAGILDNRNTRYSIVNENGASIYSCSAVAKKEFPTMDMNLISAVSIARRLNDPLSEYVKIEPRHLGVGMYQHDVNEKTLTETLNDVVSECVSYVGVDLNTASLSVLKHIAGLSEKKAEKIIEQRIKKGPFQTRKDLLAVRGIGEKTYVQCAGFIRIEPLSVGGKLINPLDCTWVHPESYKLAEDIISKCELKVMDIGKPSFRQRVKDYSKSQNNLEELATAHKLPIDRLKFVLDALQRELLQDYRVDLDKRPLFKQGLTRLEELSIGDVVTGAVTNVTHFGAFVDIGVERDGLIHKSHMQNSELSIGDRIIASVLRVDMQRRQLGLQLENMLQETDTSFTLKTNL